VVGVFSLALTVLGWFIIIRNSKRLAKRSELISLCNYLDQDFSKLDDLAVNTWSVAEKSVLTESEESSIALVISNIELRLELIKKHYLNENMPETQIFLYRRACTSPVIIHQKRALTIRSESLRIRSSISIACFQHANKNL
jgi:hypothetical protein